jgi:hypothetical protein
MTSTTLFRLLRLVVLALVCVIAADAALSAEAALDSDRAALIRDLGASDYQVREEAARSLMAQGMAAEPALRQAMLQTDLEIRLRAGEILSRIQYNDLERRLSAFISGKDDQLGEKLVAWKQFQAVLGGDRPARELYVKLYRNENELLGAVDLPRDERERAYLARVERVQQELYGRVGGVRTPPSADTIAALLLVAVQEEGALSIHAGIQTYSMLMQPDVKKVVTTGDHAAQLEKLLGAWVARTIQSTSIARYGLMVALEYEMKDSTRDLARQLLADKNTSNSVLPYAALALGKYGEKSDVDRLEPLLENKNVCHTWHNGRFPDTIKIQVRDVALAVLVELTGQNHKEYGFDLLQRNSSTLFQIYTCGFVKNDDREKAVIKWRKWRSA